MDVRGLLAPHIGDGWHDLRSDPDAVDGVVQRLLVVRDGQGRDLGACPAADLGDRLVSDRVGDVAPAAGPYWSGPGRELLSGVVEVDETFIGGQEPGLAGGRARGKKALACVGVEVKSPKGFGRCRMAIIEDATAKTAA